MVKKKNKKKKDVTVSDVLLKSEACDSFRLRGSKREQDFQQVTGRLNVGFGNFLQVSDQCPVSFKRAIAANTPGSYC